MGSERHLVVDLWAPSHGETVDSEKLAWEKFMEEYGGVKVSVRIEANQQTVTYAMYTVRDLIELKIRRERES